MMNTTGGSLVDFAYLNLWPNHKQEENKKHAQKYMLTKPPKKEKKNLSEQLTLILHLLYTPDPASLQSLDLCWCLDMPTAPDPQGPQVLWQPRRLIDQLEK